MTGAASARPPGSARALRWWTPAALAGLHRRLDAVWQPWCEGWGFQSAGVRGANASEAGAVYAAVRRWYGVGVFEHDGVWMGVAEHEPAGWIGRGLFQDASGPMAERVAMDAWRDLQRDLAMALGVTAVDEVEVALPTALPAGHRLPWSGAVAFRLAVADDPAGVVVVHVGPDTAAQWRASGSMARSPRAPHRALSSVAEALRDRPLKLEVHLGEAEIELGMLQSLRIGDVAVLSSTLDQPLTVRWPTGSTVLFEGHLGRLGGHKAVEIVPASHPR